MEARGRILMKEFIARLQKNGAPVFFIRDTSGMPSVTLTLVVLSGFFICFGLVNGIVKLVGGIDMQSALYWHGMSLAAYLGRKFSKDEGLGAEEKKSKQD